MDSATLAKQLTDYDTNRKSSVDVLNEAMGKYGVPEIRTRVAGLRTTLSNTENALNNVDPSVTGRTQGSLVTEAQRQRQVTNERAPIAEQYGQQERALGVESGNLNDSLGAARLLAENQVNDYSAGRTALQSRYSDAVSRESEIRRREEADRAFRLEEQKAADARAQAAQAAAGYSIGGGSASARASAPKTDPVQQTAYNDVYTRVSNQSDAELQGDFRATARSAARGNTKDKYKLDLYRQLRPDLFSNMGQEAISNFSELRF